MPLAQLTVNFDVTQFVDLVKRIVMHFYTYMYSNGVGQQVLTTLVKALSLVV